MTTSFVPREEFETVVAELRHMKELQRELYERRGITREALIDFGAALDDIQEAARRGARAVRMLLALYPADPAERAALAQPTSSTEDESARGRSDPASPDRP